MMRVITALLATATVAAAPLEARQARGRTAQQQQQRRPCQMFVDSVGGTANFQTLRDGTQQIFAGGGITAHCMNDATTRMRSDSLAYYEARSEVHLIGNVHFEDSTAVLDADRVNYWTRQERLWAEGNVYTRNLRTGSEMRGPNLDYYRAVPPVRDTVLFHATGRPTMHFRPQGDSITSRREPFVVVADRVRMVHTDRMWGSGRVTIDRSDLNARADSAMLNLGDSVGYLIGAPEVVGRDTTVPGDSGTYRLTGQRIRFDLTADQEIRRAVSTGRARATGPDWVLRGDTLDISLDSGRVNRARAWGLMDDDQPTAHSGLSVVFGDSLDIQMPGQVMRLVLSFGRARAQSRPDSATVDVDWLSGDTLRAAFEVTDSAGTRRTEIDRVDARGTARAYYHVDNERDPGGQRGITYSRGDRIRIALHARKVRTVDVVGQVDGIYLEPRPRAAADTTSSDTTRSRAARGRP
jgi:lipopolysaccharide export system protein LptA